MIALCVFDLDGEINQCKFFSIFDLCPIAMAQPLVKAPGDWEVFEGAHHFIYWSTVAEILAAPPRNHPETFIQRVPSPTSSRCTSRTSMCHSEMSMQQLCESKWASQGPCKASTFPEDDQCSSMGCSQLSATGDIGQGRRRLGDCPPSLSQWAQQTDS